jgi:two-component system sensor histidine kinase AlgZ
VHPLLARPARLLLVVTFAAFAGVALASILRLLEPRPWTAALAFAVPLTVVYGFIVLSAWWVCRRNPISGDAAWAAVLVQCGAALQATAVWTALGTAWWLALDRALHSGLTRGAMFHDLAMLFAAGIPFYLMSAVGHYLFLAFEASHAAERRVLETEVGAREAELRALRAQLNPHFLFNSLNSINALVGSDPEGARRMCEGLGDFLRRTLALGARDEVTLGEELALVERYLGIEQVRFGDRLRVERAVEPAAAACHVPPLLLQPLVENAIKHGIQDCVAGGVIRIEATCAGGALRVAVENPVDPDAPLRRGEGVGLENVRRRLEVFGARESQLTAARDGDVFRVLLTLPAFDGVAGSGGGRG